MSLGPAYLVDASVYIFRAWYSVPDEFATGRGEPTNAVYGFTGFLCSLLEQAESDHLAIAFDASLTTSFRNEIYPDYKANREPAPAELKRQFEWAREVAEALGLRCFADPRYEADDLIGTLSEYWRARGHPVCLVSSDKDLLQLIREGDTWWDFARRRKLDHHRAAEAFGVRPEQMADYLALTGDSVDNIPGVPGVGPKTAAALLRHFDDLENLFARLEEVPYLSIRGAASVHRRLGEHREKAELARQLTLIHTEVPSALKQPEIRRGAIDAARLNRVFDELAFGAMLRQRCLQTA
ncbi:MAG: exodeoxyribonuclease IX [Xanthomonadales bacterium]|nr:exodeoxyribonuclease IX [Xanthomonadales bacterium]NIN59998.1 exodeoxyribonuclease IX [Xanthomonadales bacterium]NIN75366.1 exodeoxyribonuclease IX [Xanthomonadales bacterium]NIO14189.1 exodeoxyribonuclease IX [Xanthomonadales bacterium]NIP12391.1 exodeoxyribonuclease IX [Xanthomonadales bacterium]